MRSAALISSRSAKQPGTLIEIRHRRKHYLFRRSDSDLNSVDVIAHDGNTSHADNYYLLQAIKIFTTDGVWTQVMWHRVIGALRSRLQASDQLVPTSGGFSCANTHQTVKHHNDTLMYYFLHLLHLEIHEENNWTGLGFNDYHNRLP